MTHTRIITAVLCGTALWAHVASADDIVLDLSSNNTVVDLSDGAVFTRTDVQPTGTGYIDPFVRIQASPTESGYNTDGIEEFNTKDAGGTKWNHSIRMTDVGLVKFTWQGVTDDYREFLLDIDEPGQDKKDPDDYVGTRYITLNRLQVYISNRPDLTKFNPDTYKFLEPENDTRLVYELNGYDIELNAKLPGTGPGNGQGDMLALIPNSLFVEQAKKLGLSNPYVYLYSSFGDPDSSEASFEEWSCVEGGGPPIVIPLPSTAWAALTMLGLLGGTALLRRRSMFV